MFGADAARSAGNTQADASRAGTAAQLHMFDTVNQQQLPYRQSGYNALNALNFGLGLPTTRSDSSGNPVAAPGAPDRAKFTTAGTPGGWARAGGGEHGETIWKQSQGTPGSFDQAGYDSALASFNANQGAPGTSMPQTGANGLSGGQFTHQFNANDLNANLAPNYQFQLDQGLGAVRNAGNLSTGLVSGNTLKGINDYAQNYAGGAYQQAYNNYNQNQTNIFNRLSNIAGLGQTANQSTGSAATATGQGVANTIQAGGAASAAGTVGQANAISGALNNAGGWYALSQFANKGGNV